jgi:hypothetical protein
MMSFDFSRFKFQAECNRGATRSGETESDRETVKQSSLCPANFGGSVHCTGLLMFKVPLKWSLILT